MGALGPASPVRQRGAPLSSRSVSRRWDRRSLRTILTSTFSCRLAPPSCFQPPVSSGAGETLFVMGTSLLPVSTSALLSLAPIPFRSCSRSFCLLTTSSFRGARSHRTRSLEKLWLSWDVTSALRAKRAQTAPGGRYPSASRLNRWLVALRSPFKGPYRSSTPGPTLQK